MNDETGLLLCQRAGRAQEGGRLLNYAVVISGLLGTLLSQQVAAEDISQTDVALRSRDPEHDRENVSGAQDDS